jgi:hypothetical protein
VGTGANQFGGDGGPAANARLNFPTGLAMDSALNLYVSDCFNHRIRRVLASNASIYTYAGNGNTGNAPDNVVATSNALPNPYGISIDMNDDLFAADINANIVRRINASNGVMYRAYGNGTLGNSGNDGPHWLA